MKKIVLSFFLTFVFVLGPSLAFAQVDPDPVWEPECTNLTTNMWLGSTDSSTNGQVTKLQNFLIQNNNYLNISAPTGNFGPLTKQAVSDFQHDTGINPTAGFVGTITRTTIAWLTGCTVQANMYALIPATAINNYGASSNSNGSNNGSSNNNFNLNPQNPSNPTNPTVPNNSSNNNLNNLNFFGNNNQNNSGTNSGGTLGQNPNQNNNPVNPNPNPNPTTATPVNPNPLFQPCPPLAVFNVITGAPCNPNVNPAPVNPANPVPVACTPVTPPSITLVTPNGGEKFSLNDDIKVLWTSCNPIIDTVTISLINQTGNNPLTFVRYPLAINTANDGNEAVKLTPPAGMPPFQLGTAFKIRIDMLPMNSASSLNIFDESDDLFTIN